MVEVIERTETAQNGATPEPMGLTHPQDIDSAAQVIFDFLLAQGRASKDEIRPYCKDAGIDTPTYQKAFDRLDRQLNIITEVSNENGTKAWVLKDIARKGLSLRELIDVSSVVAGTSKPKETFGEWYRATGHFVLESPVLASRPGLEASSRVFFRSGDNILLLSGNYAAMFKSAARMPGAPAIGNARYHIHWNQALVPAKLITTELCPSPPSRPGGSGTGVTSCESLPPGTEIPFSAIVPGSHVTPADFGKLLHIAGELVGFSPAAAHLGFGRFVPKMSN